MSIEWIRVDDRLIHGQVAVGWTRAKGITHIVVANDEVAKDDLQIMLLNIATPVGTKSSILTVDDASKKLKDGSLDREKEMIVVKDAKTILELISKGIDIKHVNVGNVRMKEGRKRITKEVAATDEEIKDWKELDKMNVELEAKWLPNNSSKDFNKIIRKI